MLVSESRRDVVIIGAGVIGLVTAWRALQRGLTVTLVDPEPGSKASHVAAGMLAPVSEITYGEEPMLRLGLASLDRYPAFVAELEEVTGQDTGYRADGLLHVAFDGSDLASLDDLRRFQESLGVRAEALTGRECRTLEPMLAPSVRGGLLAPDAFVPFAEEVGLIDVVDRFVLAEACGQLHHWQSRMNLVTSRRHMRGRMF